MADARRRTIKRIPHGFGSIATPASRGEVKAFLDGLRVNQHRFMLVAINADQESVLRAPPRRV